MCNAKSCVWNKWPIASCAFSLSVNESTSGRQFVNLHTETLLVMLPTPDFSMPYNVICLACTVVAIAFGSIHNLTTRRFTAVDPTTKGLLAKLKAKIPFLRQKKQEDKEKDRSAKDVGEGMFKGRQDTGRSDATSWTLSLSDRLNCQWISRRCFLWWSVIDIREPQISQKSCSWKLCGDWYSLPWRTSTYPEDIPSGNTVYGRSTSRTYLSLSRHAHLNWS